MPRFFLFFALLASLLGVERVHAQSTPIVVELFTSQGCSSCPPADDYLAELIGRDDVLALALHVDYWDRLGWADTFAQAAFTERQYQYAKRFGNRSVWTPQFVVNGNHYSKGNWRGMVEEYVAKERSSEPLLALSAAEEGEEMLLIRAVPLESNLDPMVVSIAYFTPRAEVRVRRGENAGHTLAYHNIVTKWQVVGRWNGEAPAEVTVPLDGKKPYAVLVQTEYNQGYVAASVIE